MTIFEDTLEVKVPVTEPIMTVTNASDVRVYSMHHSLGDPNSQVTGTTGDRCWDSTNRIAYKKDSGTATNTGWIQEQAATADTYFTGTGGAALASATAAVTVPMNAQSLTFDAVGILTVNSSAKMQVNAEGLKIDPVTGGTAGFIELADADSSHTAVIMAADVTTANLIYTLPPSLPTAGTEFLKVDPVTGDMSYGAPDGNVTNITDRGDSITGVEPTAGEAPSPVDGDVANVFLDDETQEVWAHNGTAWSLVQTITPGTVPDASETVKGKAEIATSAEVLTGTDNTRIVTPAGLASKVKQQRIIYGDGALTELTLAHSLGTAEFTVQVEVETTGEVVQPTIVSKSSSDVVIRHAFIPTLNQFAATVAAIL